MALAEIAAVTGYTVDELAADPAALTGGAGQQLTDLLIGLQSPQRADLFGAARAAVDAESRAGWHTPAGRALAVLLAGLRREQVTDR